MRASLGSMGLLLGGVLLAGCASTAGDSIIVDMQGVDPVAYRQDLAACTAYAEQVDAGGQVAANTAGGAAVGAGIGTIARGSEGTGRGAAGGAIIGAARGVNKAYTEQQRVVRNCLRGRGYRVLN